MHSCLYFGRVAHVRHEPITHRFRYSVAMAYLDLDEADGLVRRSRVLSGASFAPLSFRAADHVRDLKCEATPTALASAIRELAGRETELSLAGPVRLLTPLRSWGAWFSPLNLYFCFNEDGRRVDAVVAEVSNTPWNERRRYVLGAMHRAQGDRDLRFQHAKDFHVSPFLAMDMQYDWRLSEPGERLRAAIRCRPTPSPPGGRTTFDAALTLVRRPWSDRGLAALACRYPASSVQVLAAIYWQAFRLWTKRCPFYPHPRTATAS